jgi:HK97 family phage portal protein
MAWFGRKAEKRAPVTSEVSQFWAPYVMPSASGEVVTVESALGVPAVMAAVEVIATTVAGLPLQVFRKTKEGREPSNQGLQAVLNDVANEIDLISAFDLFKWWVEQALTVGRGVLFIERADTGRVLNLWPLDPNSLTIARVNGRRVYKYKDGSRTVEYGAADVLDLPFMLKGNFLENRSPILANRDVIGLAQAVTKYGGNFFSNGGVPPFAVTGAFQSGQSMQRAADDLAEAVKKAAKDKRQALVLPAGLDIKPIGVDAEKSQMTETQRFVIEQIARIYSLPPVLLQDLTHGTFSNTEQQDLHFVKHTIMRWAGQIEGELNLKLFGRSARTTYVEFNLDGLLRGDFMTRMQGYAQAIQHGVLMPNEARELENRSKAEGGDTLLVQGAMVPISQAGQTQQQPTEPPADLPDEGDQDEQGS